MFLAAALLAHFASEPIASSDQVIFMSDRDGSHQIWLADVDGGNARRLTDGPRAHFPRCSPDGRRIVFERGAPYAREIWVLNRADGSRTRVGISGAAYSTPEWMPDGLHIVFTQRVGDYDRIALLPADGSGETRAVTANAWNDVMPFPTPDGKGLVFHSYRHGADQPEIYHLDLESGRERRLTQSEGQDYEAASDGRRLVFSSNREGGPFQLYLGDLDGAAPRRLTDGAQDAWGGHPGQAGILFVTGAPGQRKPHLVGPDGVTRRLWSGAGDDYSAGWCPPAA